MHHADRILNPPLTTAEQYLLRAVTQEQEAKFAEEKGWKRSAESLHAFSRHNFRIAVELELGACLDDLHDEKLLAA